jgi:hypothetical protein
MNYDCPRQRETDKRWDYTSSNRRTGTYPVGYCGGWWLDEKFDPQRFIWMDEEQYNHEVAKHIPFREKYHTNGHATKEEAYECYKTYMLDLYLDFDKVDTDHQNKCKVCGEWTQKGAWIRGGHMHEWDLCDKHLNRETVEQLFDIGDSWHS